LSYGRRNFAIHTQLAFPFCILASVWCISFIERFLFLNFSALDRGLTLAGGPPSLFYHRSWGLIMRLTRRKATNIRRLRERGFNLTEIARKYRASLSSIHAIIMNKTFRDPHWTPPMKLTDKAEHELSTGKSLQEVADVCGVKPKSLADRFAGVLFVNPNKKPTNAVGTSEWRHLAAIAERMVQNGLVPSIDTAIEKVATERISQRPNLSNSDREADLAVLQRQIRDQLDQRYYDAC
jgi:AraC-like DNA-binding protein